MKKEVPKLEQHHATKTGIGKNQRYYFWRDCSTATHHHYDACFDTRSKELLRKNETEKGTG